jgi:phage shock protein PspC (stress-responsive transcriptional regulator)
MKKNITINLYGTLYAIDEDAYNLLERYLDSMKSYFRNKEGGDEIADDIEHRVAELLWEQKQEGHDAVNIEMIKEIISKIGNPEDIANDGENADSGKADAQNDESSFSKRAGQFTEDAVKTSGNFFSKFSSRMRGRRLYRNPNDKVVGGVCSGLAEFFMTGDPLWWRLGFVLLTLITMGSHRFFFFDSFSLAVPALYIILIIIVPVASTPADRLRMKGQKVSPENLKEQVISEVEVGENGVKDSPVSAKSSHGGCVRALFIALMIVLLLPLFVSLWGLLAAIIGMFCVLFGAGPAITAAVGDHWLVDFVAAGGPYLWIGLISGIVSVTIPIYAILHAINSTAKPMSGGKIMLLIIVWLISAAFVAASFIMGIINMQALYPNMF